MLLYQKESLRTLINPIAIGRRLHRHRRLLWQFVLRDIQLQHKGSMLGLAWSLISPLLLFGAYAFAFIAILKGRFGVVPNETRAEYAIALFLSLALFQLFQEAITLAPLVVVQNSNYVKKVVFPLEVLPVAIFGAALFRCLISLALVIVATSIWGTGLSVTAWWFPIIVAMLALLSLGASWTLSALGVFLRDLAPLMQFLSVVLMFTSGVFYSLDKVPAAFSFLRYNPLWIILEAGRRVLLWHLAPNMNDLLYLGMISIGFCLVGNLIFRALTPAFSDVL
jgi:lipopolysaccharide transport system permease protein